VSNLSTLETDAGEHRNPLNTVDHEVRIRAFDFSHKETIDRGRLRILSGLLDSISHRFASTTSAEIRQSVHIELDDMDQLTWETYATGLPEVTALSTASVLPLADRFVMHAALPLAFELLDFYFGGDGTMVGHRDQLTDLEREILGSICEVIWSALPSAFGGLVEVSIGSVQHSHNALLLQAIRANEMCLVVKFRVGINDRPGQLLELVTTIEVVEAIVESLEEQQFSEFARNGGGSQEASERLEVTPVEVRVSYPMVSLTADEILGLCVGQTVVLKEGKEAPPVQVIVGGRPVATASIDREEEPMICRIINMEVQQ
jgi:flagellar motor switch protein FliM